MSQKTHYEHLELPPTASADEIKKAFRALIARYHPDKVQHLGKEFQDMAADRAAELTEAYRILSDAGRRADYDRMLGAAPAAPPPSAAKPAPSPPAEQPARGPKRRKPGDAAAAEASARPRPWRRYECVQAGARRARRVASEGDAEPVPQALTAVGGV